MVKRRVFCVSLRFKTINGDAVPLCVKWCVCERKGGEDVGGFFSCLTYHVTLSDYVNTRLTISSLACHTFQEVHHASGTSLTRTREITRGDVCCGGGCLRRVEIWKLTQYFWKDCSEIRTVRMPEIVSVRKFEYAQIFSNSNKLRWHREYQGTTLRKFLKLVCVWFISVRLESRLFNWMVLVNFPLCKSCSP